MASVAYILGGEKVLGQKISGAMDYDTLIKKGIPMNVIPHIKKEFDLSDSVIARIIGVSPRTFSRRRTDFQGT